jgi:hypothetical protein
LNTAVCCYNQPIYCDSNDKSLDSGGICVQRAFCKDLFVSKGYVREITSEIVFNTFKHFKNKYFLGNVEINGVKLDGIDSKQHFRFFTF